MMMGETKISLQVVLLLGFCAAFQLCTCFNSGSGLHRRHLVASNDSGHCPPRYWAVNGTNTRCFHSVSKSKSWDEAEAYCKNRKGHLASLSSPQDFKFFQELCHKHVTGCWIGGRVSSNTSQAWTWSDNTPLNDESLFPKLEFGVKCGNLSCYNNKTNDSCTLLSNGVALLKAVSCNETRPFFCMIHVECHRGQCHNLYKIILAAISGIILCTTLAIVTWLLVYRRSKKRKRSRKQSNSAASALVPPSWKVYTIEELRSISKNFSEGNRLPGDSKTGGTYSGVLPDGSKVAIKRLKRSNYQRKKEFYSEIGRVARLHHPSLVAVKGCCYNHGDRYIVYEFIINGPLDRWLHNVPRGGRCLTWAMRMNIATSLAQGIAFLHDKVKPQVVHRDIRASNVLLDEDFAAHLIGVGLSKFVPWDIMQERNVMAGGTHGYLAPEFVYRNELTTKSDVYSFGVLLLEIVTGRRPAQAVDSVGWQSIFEWATPLVQSHRYPELLDPVMTSSSSEIPEAAVIQKVVDLVYACTQHVPSMRPRMSHVVHQLQQLAPSTSSVQ